MSIGGRGDPAACRRPSSCSPDSEVPNLHILYVTPALPPFVGGGEAYVGALAREMLRRQQRVTVVTSDAQAEPDFWQRHGPSSLPAEEHRDGLHILRCRATGFPGGRPGLMAWRKAMILLSLLPGERSALLLEMARRVPPLSGLDRVLDLVGSPDLVHAFNLSWEHGLVAGWRMARERNLPFVVTPFAHLGTGPRDRAARNHTMAHQLRLLRDAEAVLTLTTCEQAGLAAHGVPAGRLHVVGGGVPPPGTDASPSDVQRLLDGLDLMRPFVLFIGRVCRDKGAMQTVEAVLRLNKAGRQVDLALAGRAAPDFLRYYRSLPASDKDPLHVLGEVDEPTKQVLLQACSMLVLPSRVDSFGIVLLEAWTHAKPVIGARAGGIPGVIAEGENGLLVPYGDSVKLAEAVAFLLDHPDTAAAMGACGQARVGREYTWGAVAERVLRVYQDVLAGSRGSIGVGC